MKRRHLVFTRTSEDSPLHQCCHKFTLEPFLVKKGKKRLKKVTWQCRHHANYLQDLVENKDMWMSTSILHNFVQTICHLPVSSFTYRKLWANGNIKRSLVSLGWNSYPLPKKQWCNECQSDWFHLQRVLQFLDPHIKQYLEVFIHGFDKNVGQNPALDNLSPFQNYLRQHSKTDSALHMAKHLRTVS